MMELSTDWLTKKVVYWKLFKTPSKERETTSFFDIYEKKSVTIVAMSALFVCWQWLSLSRVEALAETEFAVRKRGM